MRQNAKQVDLLELDVCGIFAGGVLLPWPHLSRLRLQVAGDLFEPGNGGSGRRLDILLDELTANMPIGDPVDAACPGFLLVNALRSGRSGPQT